MINNRAFSYLLLLISVMVMTAASAVMYSAINREDTNNSAKLISSTTIVNSSSTYEIGTSSKKIDILDVTKIPIGDGKYSNSAKAGYIFSCQTNFNSNAPGSDKDGPWIHGKTWNLKEKLSVSGKIVWPDAKFAMTLSNDKRNISGNALPVETYTGNFPISKNDSVYSYDKNPNNIKSQNISLSIPLNPIVNKNPSCLPGGMIGIATNGVAIFNGLDEGGRDAVAHEAQDICSGHPQQEGEYHYHGPSLCLPKMTENNTLVGYALDGFGIYSLYDGNGKEYVNSDLDACHGTSTSVMWNGKIQNIYHYVMTREYPYTVGCYRGTAVKTDSPKMNGPINGNGPKNLPPNNMMNPADGRPGQFNNQRNVYPY